MWGGVYEISKSGQGSGETNGGAVEGNDEQLWVRVESVGNVKVVRDESGQSMAVEIGSRREFATNCDVRAAGSMLVTPFLK